MYCSKCGRQIPDGASSCPECGAVPQVEVQQINEQPVNGKEPRIKAPGKGSRSYAAIFTALLVFPASICVAVDLVFDRYDYWFGYVLGALIVTWVIAVLPVLRITPPLVTGLICFASIVLYVSYIVGKTGHFMWLSKFMLPMFILTAAFIAMDAALIGRKIKGLHILSFLCAQAMIYIIALEAIIDNASLGAINLRWSLIVACGFISAIAVIEAFSYVGRINRK